MNRNGRPRSITAILCPHPERGHFALGKCSQCYFRDYRRAAPRPTRAQMRDRNLRGNHGLTQAEYDALLAAQGGVCAICRRAETHRGRSGAVQALSVDHDHRTGRIRGLTCHCCNFALGLLSDDPDRMEAAAAYIRRSRLSAAG